MKTEFCQFGSLRAFGVEEKWRNWEEVTLYISSLLLHAHLSGIKASLTIIRFFINTASSNTTRPVKTSAQSCQVTILYHQHSTNFLHTICLYYHFVCGRCGRIDERLARFWGTAWQYNIGVHPSKCPKNGDGGTRTAPEICAACESRNRRAERCKVWGVWELFRFGSEYAE
jgi:hypothetical protein